MGVLLLEQRVQRACLSPEPVRDPHLVPLPGAPARRACACYGEGAREPEDASLRACVGVRFNGLDELVQRRCDAVAALAFCGVQGRVGSVQGVSEGLARQVATQAGTDGEAT